MRAVAAALLCVAPAALADSTAVDRMLRAQTAALIASDETAFASTLARDAYVGLGLERPRIDYTLQSGLTEPSQIVWNARKIGWAGTCGWVAGEATFTNPPHPEQGGRKPTKHVRRWLALVVRDGAAVKTKVMQVSHARLDRDLGTFKYISELPVAPTTSPLVALLADPSGLAARLARDPTTSVFGSAPGERAVGPAAAKRLLARWKRLRLQIVDAKDARDRDFYEQREIVAGDCAAAYARVRLQRAPGVHVLFHGFLIARKAGSRWEVVAASYGGDH